MKLIVLVLVLVLIPAVVFSAPGPETVPQQLQKSVEKAAAIGQQNSVWERERGGIIQEIQNAELQLEWATFQLERTERLLAAEQQNILILQQNMREAQQTRDQLAPFLEVLYADLENHIIQDLPFQEEERRRRLDFIRGTLDDPAAGLSDKIGRLLEAMQVELDYGYTVDVTEAIIEQDGHKEQAIIFRLGRLTMFRLLEGGTHAQRYNRVSKNWDDIADDAVKPIVYAIEIARKNRVTSILSLPIGTFAELAEIVGGNS